MSKIKSLSDVLLEELKDLYNAENQLMKALPKMAKKASNEQLRSAIEAHLEETENQVTRLDQIGEILGKKLSGKTCKAMQGLIEEGKEILEEESSNTALIDSLLIGAAQRIEHYEIAGYGTARALAEALGEDEVARLLQETLDEESAADEKLTMISEEEVLPEAAEAAEGEFQLDAEGQSEKGTSKSKGSSGRAPAR